MTEKQIITALRAIMNSKRVKLTDIAIKIDVPYRSLQNWFSMSSSMPLPIYIAICNELGLSGAFGEITANLLTDDEEDQTIVQTIEHINLLATQLPIESRDWLRILQGDVLRLVQVICDQRIRLRAFTRGN